MAKNDAPTPEAKTITIYDNEFQVTQPYSEGVKMELSAGEAHTLNQARAENIANNMRAKVKKALDIEDEAERADALATVNAEFVEYDAGYEFIVGATGSRSTMSPLERETIRVAKASLVVRLRQADLTLKAYTEDKGEEYVQAKIAEIAALPDIIEEAQRQLEVKKAQAEATSSIDI